MGLKLKAVNKWSFKSECLGNQGNNDRLVPSDSHGSPGLSGYVQYLE